MESVLFVLYRAMRTDAGMPGFQEMGFGAFFGGPANDEYKAFAKERLLKRLAFVDQQLEGRDYLMGAQFTVADAYLFTVSNWAQHVAIDLAHLKNLTAYRARVAARPAVQATMKAEGLTK